MQSRVATPEFERAALGLFAAAVEREPEERPGWLAAACRGDEALHRRVMDLLAADTAGDSDFLVATDAEDPDTVAADEPLVPPPQIGVYRLEELIGAGGMGAVYRASRNDGLFEQSVAVKFIRRLRGVPEIEPLVDAERKLLARMEHPGIARILDGGRTAEGLHYLVMEFVRGVALDRHVEERGLDSRERVLLLREVCAAIAHAHQNLVLHCDIKPANILVTLQGRPKLIDFGVARIQDAVDASLPQGFTRAYTSPQRQAGEPATVADDIFSLGVVLHELISGRLPDDDAAGGMALPWELAAIAQKAMAPLRGARYPSVTSFDDDLGAWLERRPVAAAGRNPGYRARKLIERHPWRVAAGLAALSGLVLSVIIVALMYVRAEAARADAERRFAEVRSLAKFMLFDLYDRLEGLPRSLALRRDVAATAQQFLSRLAEDARAPAQLQTETLEGLVRLAAVQGSQLGSRLGEVDAAKANLAQADAIATRLQAAGLASWRLAHLRAQIALQEVGIHAEVDNDLAAAEASLNTARAQLDRALTQAPQQPQIHWTNAEWFAAAAAVRSWRSRYGEAAAFAQQAERALASFAPSQRESRAGRILAARVADLQAEARFYGGDARGAAQLYAQELARLEQAAGDTPPDQAIARSVARAEWALGTTYLSIGRVAEASALTGRALDGARAISLQDPEDDDAAHLRSVAELAYAQSLAAAGNTAEALATLGAEVERRRQAESLAPQNPSLARRHAIALFALADLYADAHRKVEACDLYSRGFGEFAAIGSTGKLTPRDRDYAIGQAKARQASLGCR